MRFSIYRMYKLMIAISIYRIKNGHLIDLPNHFNDEYYPLLMSIPNFEEILVHFSEKLGLEITPDIIAQIFISFIQHNLFLDPQEFFNSLEENSEARYSYQLLSQILERLAKQYKDYFLPTEMNLFGIYTTQLSLKDRKSFLPQSYLNKKH